MVAKSFAHLVKNNNGAFESEAQAKFLLSQCDKETKFVDDTPKGAVVFYHCDDRGVTFVERYNMTDGKTKREWGRKVAGKLTVQDDREIKRLRRMKKDTEESIAARDIAYAKGDYKNEEFLYAASNGWDRATLIQIEAKIKEIQES